MIENNEGFRPRELKPAQRETEELTVNQRADIVRMSRVDAILQEELSREGMPDVLSGGIWRHEEDVTFIFYNKGRGFFIQWGGPATYLEVQKRVSSYGESTRKFFSHFLSSSYESEPYFESLSAKIKEAVVAEPTTDELQQLPEILAADHQRIYEEWMNQIKISLDKGQIWGIPSDLDKARENARLAGIKFDEQSAHEFLLEYFKKRREWDFTELPKVEGSVLNKIMFLDRLIEADNFFGDPHSQEVKDLAGDAAIATVKMIPEVESNYRSDERSSRIEHFNHWSNKAIKWAEVAGIDITPQLEKLRVELREKTKPPARKLLEFLQQKLSGKQRGIR